MPNKDKNTNINPLDETSFSKSSSESESLSEASEYFGKQKIESLSYQEIMMFIKLISTFEEQRYRG